MIAQLSANPAHTANVGAYVGRLGALLGVTEIDLHIEEVTGQDKTLDVVVDIFNRVNSGGTKLSKGDLALAKICAEWPEARDFYEGQTEGVDRRRISIQPRLAVAFGEHRSDRRSQVQLSTLTRARSISRTGSSAPTNTSTRH